MIRDARRIGITAALAAIQFALAATRIAPLPLPTGLNVSVFAIPAALAGVLAGVVSAAIVGAIFGVMTLVLATTPLFQNPIVALVPRVVFGPIAALTYLGVRRINEPLALVLAGAIAPVMNTGLVLVLAAVLTSPVGAPYVSPEAAWDVARTSIPAEAVLSALVTLAVGLAARAAKLAQP